MSSAVDDENQLIEAARVGDLAAFGQLVSRYQDRLFNTLLHATGHWDDAEEVTQETFVLAFRKLASFQGRSGFYTWLYRIGFNVWISRTRKKRSTTSIDALREASGNDPVAEQETPDQRMEREERIGLVRHAMERLPDDYRTILVLREMDGLDYEAIAQILDVPIGTVRSRIHRARALLKRELEPVLGES